MPPRQPSTPNASSPVSLSSWPVIKYSYSASSLSSSIQPPWTHFAHRDNVFLVIDTQRVPGHIQQDGKFSDHQTRLKIVWGLETLESLDLTSLAQQIAPPHDLHHPNKPAFVALGRSPSLAIRYFRAEDQTVPKVFKTEKSADKYVRGLQTRRFQIKLLSEAAYHAASALLEQAKCPIGIPPVSRDGGRYDQPSQPQAPPLFPHLNNSLAQHIPPGTSSDYSNTSSSSGVVPAEPHSSNGSISYLGNVSPIQTHGLAASAVPRDFCGPFQAPQTPSHSNISYSYLPDVTEPLNDLIEDIPPPRPPPFGPRKPLDSPRTYGIMPNSITSIRDLPPLPRPTPLKGSSPSIRDLSMTSPLDREPSKYCEPDFDCSGSGLGTDTLQRDPPPAPKKRVGVYRPGLPGIIEERPKRNNSNSRSSFPVFPRGFKKLGAESCTPASSSPRQGALTSITIPNIGDANTGGKRKQIGDKKEGQEQEKKLKVVLTQDESPNAYEEDEFRQIEDFIVNAIHDDDFLKLVERIGCVWQRMGFDNFGVHLFGSG